MKHHRLTYKKGLINIRIATDNHSIVGSVNIEHEDFVTSVKGRVLYKLVKTDEAYTKRDIKLLALHIINKCTPFAFDKDHNEIADKNIIKFVNP